MSDTSNDLPDDAGKQSGDAAGAASPARTPMFKAYHAARYQRQALIKAVSDAQGRPLICYVSGRGAQIDREDVSGFVDLLHNVPRGSSVDLLLHTGGGDIDAAEKLLSLIQQKLGATGELRVIVPDHAKSAGTLMALGANQILMSDSSELGTIDPQTYVSDGKGNDGSQSVLCYLQAYDLHAAALKKDPTDPVAKIMLEKLDPATLEKYRLISQRARAFAEAQLKKRGLNYSEIASALMDIRRWPSHGQMINYDEAHAIGLHVVHIPTEDSYWQQLWEIFCLQRVCIEERQKLFESSYVSLLY